MRERIQKLLDEAKQRKSDYDAQVSRLDYALKQQCALQVRIEILTRLLKSHGG